MRLNGRLLDVFCGTNYLEQKRAAAAIAAQHAREEREQLRKKFEAEQIPADALQHVIWHGAKGRGEWREGSMVLHFPSDFLPDSGRRISIGSKDWTEHLSG